MNLEIGSVGIRLLPRFHYTIPAQYRGVVSEVSGERWMVLVKLFDEDEQEHVFRDCIIDTGSPISFFPHHRWEKFQEYIRWLGAGSWDGLPTWLEQAIGFGSRGVQCLLGEIHMQMIDLEQQTALPPAVMLARFAIDDGPKPIQHIILGLRGGHFDHVKLELDFVKNVGMIHPPNDKVVQG